jgi:GT2 family glycosyltransferase
MKIGINLLTYNQLNWTKECIRTLYKYTDKEIFDLVICDNGSTDGTVEFLKTLDAKVFYQDKNIGIAKARNLIFRYFIQKNCYDYICMIHNDMLFTPDWLDIMIKEIQPLVNCMLMGCMGIIDKQCLERTDDEREKIAFELRENYTGIANLDPRLIRPQLFNKVGLYDENFEQQDCEDVDLNKRIEDAGYDFFGTHKVVIWHGVSIARDTLQDKDYYLKRNQEYIRKKYPKFQFEKYNFSVIRWEYANGELFTLWAAR